MRSENLKKTRTRRNHRSRRKIFGTPDRPRMTVYRSNRHIYVQVIDDLAGVTLASANTRIKSVSDDLKSCGNKEAAETIGTAIAKQALNVGINCVCFDRNGYKFHGRVKALADAARKAGLAF